MQHLSELLHIHPSKQGAFAITGLAAVEQGMVSPCKCEDLASSENSFTSACITSGLDRYFVHGSSLESKNPPFGGGLIRCRAIYTSTVLHLDVSSTADDVTDQGSLRKSYPFSLYKYPHVHFDLPAPYLLSDSIPGEIFSIMKNYTRKVGWNWCVLTGFRFFLVQKQIIDFKAIQKRKNRCTWGITRSLTRSIKWTILQSSDWMIYLIYHLSTIILQLEICAIKLRGEKRNFPYRGAKRIADKL